MVYTRESHKKNNHKIIDDDSDVDARSIRARRNWAILR
jgi:hypothetical protein